MTKDPLIAAAAGAVVTATIFIGGLFLDFDVKTREAINRPVATPTPITALAPAADACHSGWKNTSEQVDHAVVFKCERGNWIVILNSDTSFSHCFDKTAAPVVFIRDPARCPGW